MTGSHLQVRLAPVQLDPDKKKQLTIESKKGSGLGRRCPIAR
jgi:hypothetical protein